MKDFLKFSTLLLFLIGICILVLNISFSFDGINLHIILCRALQVSLVLLTTSCLAIFCIQPACVKLQYW